MNINGVTAVSAGQAPAPPQAASDKTSAGSAATPGAATRAGYTSVTELADGSTITTVRNTAQAIVSVTTAQPAANPLHQAETKISTVDITA